MSLFLSEFLFISLIFPPSMRDFCFSINWWMNMEIISAFFNPLSSIFLILFRISNFKVVIFSEMSLEIISCSFKLDFFPTFSFFILFLDAISEAKRMFDFISISIVSESSVFFDFSRSFSSFWRDPMGMIKAVIQNPSGDNMGNRSTQPKDRNFCWKDNSP